MAVHFFFAFSEIQSPKVKKLMFSFWTLHCATSLSNFLYSLPIKIQPTVTSNNYHNNLYFEESIARCLTCKERVHHCAIAFEYTLSMSNPMNSDIPVATDNVVITVVRTKSTADVIRRNSDTRIIGHSDLNLAQKIETIRKNSENKFTV